MLLDQTDAPVNPPQSCEQPVDNFVENTGSKQREPKHLVLRFAGGHEPAYQPFIGYDVVLAYIISENMVGIRNGDTVTLYAMHWSHGWGNA